MILAGRGLPPRRSRSALRFSAACSRCRSRRCAGQLALRNPANWNRAVPSPTSSSATASRTRSARTRRRNCTRLLRPRRRRAALPGGVRELEPWSEAKVNSKNPSGSDADRLGRLGPAARGRSRTRRTKREAQQGRDRDRQDAGPRARADIDAGWREVAEKALEFVKRFTQGKRKSVIRSRTRPAVRVLVTAVRVVPVTVRCALLAARREVRAMVGSSSARSGCVQPWSTRGWNVQPGAACHHVKS